MGAGPRKKSALGRPGPAPEGDHVALEGQV